MTADDLEYRSRSISFTSSNREAETYRRANLLIEVVVEILKQLEKMNEQKHGDK